MSYNYLSTDKYTKVIAGQSAYVVHSSVHAKRTYVREGMEEGEFSEAGEDLAWKGSTTRSALTLVILEMKEGEKNINKV